MGFLSPWAALLGLAAAVPLILHLLHRRQGRRVVFPALRYLRQAERENARRIRLRQLLLLALRIGAIVLLALAAARPFLRTAGAEHRPSAVAIVLDNSASTGVVLEDRRLFDQLRSSALATLEAAGPEDRFWLIRAAEPLEPALPGNAGETAQRVRQTEIVAAGADLPAAVDRARGLLAAGAGGLSREIHLLSDLQATGFRGEAAAGEDDAWLLVRGPAAAPPANTGVVATEVAGGLPPRAGRAATLTATVEGDGGGAAAGSADSGDAGDSITLRLFVDDRLRTAAEAVPGRPTPLSLPAAPEGLLTGRVEADPDRLRIDDVRYFALDVRPPPTVALAADAGFVEEALAVLENGGRIQRTDGSGADVVIAPGGAGLAALREGSSVIVLPPGSAERLPALNQRLATAGVPWRYRAPDPGGEVRLAAPSDDAELASLLRDVRLRAPYGLEQTEPTADGGERIRLRLAGGEPWAVQGEIPSGGSYILLASALAPAAGTLPTGPAMVPLLDRLTGSWPAGDGARTELEAGEELVLRGRATAIRAPDGAENRVEGGAPFTAPARPGIYRILEEESEIGGFAVNVPASETPLQRRGDDALEATFPGYSVLLARDDAGWADMIYRDRRGGELWRWLVLAALGMLLAEMVIGGAGRSGAYGRREPGTRAGERGQQQPAGAGDEVVTARGPAPSTGDSWRTSN